MAPDFSPLVHDLVQDDMFPDATHLPKSDASVWVLDCWGPAIWVHFLEFGSLEVWELPKLNLVRDIKFLKSQGDLPRVRTTCMAMENDRFDRHVGGLVYGVFVAKGRGTGSWKDRQCFHH